MSSSGIYPALSGATLQGQNLEVLANNLANSASPGFRAQRVGFSEALSRARTAPKAADQRFVQVGSTREDPTPGPLKHTGGALDLALSGPGFLAVRTPQGLRYQRGGALMRRADGRLVTEGGGEVLGVNDLPLNLPPGAVQLGRRGEVTVDNKQVGTLKLVEFVDPTRLQAQGKGLYAAPAGVTAAAPAQTEVLAEYLEGANVNPVRTMTEVILTSRHYEALHRAIETFREVDSTAVKELASLS